MQKANVICLNYEESDNISYQGNRRQIQRYLDKGYYVKEERNGYWVLIKPAAVRVVLESEDGHRASFNIKQDILDYYGKVRISPKLVEKFTKECNNGKIHFYMEDNSYCFK